MTSAPIGGYRPPQDGSLGDLGDIGASSVPAYEPNESSTTDTVKDQAAQVGQTAKDSSQQVAGTAASEAKNLAGEARRQASDLTREVGNQLNEQASTQKDRATGGLRSLGAELQSMAQQGDQRGMASDLAEQAAAKAHELAGWLEQREPGTLLDEVRQLARRKPGAFLLGAAAAGVLAGRLTRGAVQANGSAAQADNGSGSPGVVPAHSTERPQAGSFAGESYPGSTPVHGSEAPTEMLDARGADYSTSELGGHR
ncbi:MAG: hypothetical protein ACXV3V_03800 [Actinomycetes bacterium]